MIELLSVVSWVGVVCRPACLPVCPSIGGLKQEHLQQQRERNHVKLESNNEKYKSAHMFKFPFNSYVYINVYWSIDYFATVVLQSAPVRSPAPVSVCCIAVQQRLITRPKLKVWISVRGLKGELGTVCILSQIQWIKWQSLVQNLYLKIFAIGLYGWLFAGWLLIIHRVREGFVLLLH